MKAPGGAASPSCDTCLCRRARDLAGVHLPATQRSATGIETSQSPKANCHARRQATDVSGTGHGILRPVRQPIKVGSGPNFIAITPNGETAYVSNQGSGTVT